MTLKDLMNVAWIDYISVDGAQYTKLITSETRIAYYTNLYGQKVFYDDFQDYMVIHIEAIKDEIYVRCHSL